MYSKYNTQTNKAKSQLYARHTCSVPHNAHHDKHVHKHMCTCTHTQHSHAHTHRNQQNNETIKTEKTTSNTATITPITIPARAPVDSPAGGVPICTSTTVNPTLFNKPM